MDALHNLEAFCSLNGPRFYNLKPNDSLAKLVRTPVAVPETFEFGGFGVVLVAVVSVSCTLRVF